MTADRNFDRLAAAFMDIGPVEAPDHVIAAILAAAETAPQARRRRTWRTWPILAARRTRLALGVAALVAVAIGAIYLVGHDQLVVPRPSPSLLPGPSGSAAATRNPTATSGVIPAAHLVIADQLAFAWQADPKASTPTYEAIAIVHNDGSGWASVDALQGASYRFFDASGNPTSSAGLFGHTAPQFIPPGGTGYLIDAQTWFGHTVQELVTIEAELRPTAYRTVADPGGGVEVTSITWQPAGSTVGLLASGTATNNGSADLPFAFVAVACVGPSGSILGMTFATIEHLAVGVPTTFTTTFATPPLQPADCEGSAGYVGVGRNPN